MHIKEIIIDGFKSYAQKTVVSGFDPHFNAITGLNGSGKSNILDSICFVLGITNLSQVRAGTLSELIYKQGQAGVTKASVTIIFENKDASSSPVGYEQDPEVTVTRQVLLGGKSKYLINGKNQTISQVNNLFHSVQLNVNNPHFLIMQGRITKVLNMKPNEILGMVEEAAGTRMYENKKNTALKTMEKKQVKLDEINNIITEEITPTLERLRGEKQHYLKWSKNNADIERLERFVVANEYYNSVKLLESSEADLQAMENDIQAKKEEIVKVNEEIHKKEIELTDVATKITGECDTALSDLKQKEERMSKDLVQITSAWQNCKAVAKDAEKELSNAKALVNETKDSVKAKEDEIRNDSNTINKAKERKEKAEENLEKLNTDYQNMSAGISSEEGEEGRTLPEQISKALSDANNAEARTKQAKMKVSHLEKTIKGVQKDMKKEESSAKKLNANKEKHSKRVETLIDRLNSLSFSSSDFAALEDEKIKLENEISEIGENVDTLSAQLAGRLSFKYSDPVKGFDRNRVKGLVAKLVTVKKPEYSTALEVVAGGKLYQVVVEDSITGKALLNKGKLTKRVTIIPLDKVSSHPVSDSIRKEAASIASRLGTSSSVAIELVGFDREVEKAVEYVFGSALIVDDTKVANQICNMTKTRTVTIEGDVYDSNGTISGGSSNNLGTTLSKLTELKAAMETLVQKKRRYSQVKSSWESLKNTSNQYAQVNDELELAKTELAAVDKHLSQTKFGMLSEKYNEMASEINGCKAEAQSMEEERKKKFALYNELKTKEEVLTKQREDKLKSIELAVKKAKQEVILAEKKFREANTKSEKLVLELETLKKDVTSSEEAVDVCENSWKQANIKEVEAQINVGNQKSLYDEAKKELCEVEAQKAELSAESKKLSREKATLLKKVDSLELSNKKISINLEKLLKDKSNADRHANGILSKYPWIESEKFAFGKEGGDYDFDSVDVKGLSRKLKILQEENLTLVKKINKKVMGMIEKAEGEYTELLRKRKVVENDKKKIQAVIEGLDVKKKSELERTWMKVNSDFGSIFSTLLPGAFSKLEPPEGLNAWEGLEVKVAFGDTWKESLSELSGGQRSLLALSLILAMLLYKPAPMYILDEVDAALDLSHTQNIGNMLKSHFSQSQFIVVSLKEGMFANANVIFRTKFVDGVSTVTKTFGTANQVGESKEKTSQKRSRNSKIGKRTTGKEN